MTLTMNSVGSISASLSIVVGLAARSVPDFYSAATNMEDQRDEVVQVIFPLSIFI